MFSYVSYVVPIGQLEDGDVPTSDYLLVLVLYALIGLTTDLIARGLERVWLRWHPAYQVKGGAA